MKNIYLQFVLIFSHDELDMDYLETHRTIICVRNNPMIEIDEFVRYSEKPTVCKTKIKYLQ
jgi:hypothetical protein